MGRAYNIYYCVMFYNDRLGLHLSMVYISRFGLHLLLVFYMDQLRLHFYRIVMN